MEAAAADATGIAEAETEAEASQGRRNNPNGNAESPVFKGAVKEMNEHVFQLHGEAVNKNQFTMTAEELTGYVALHFKDHVANVKKMINNMSDTEIPLPKDIGHDPTKTEIQILEK